MANIYCDSVSGNDTTGAGTSGNPYKTLAKGISVATTNDTILLVPKSTDYVLTTVNLPAGLTIKSSTGLPPDMVNSVYARLSASGTATKYTLLGNVTFENVVFYNWVGTSTDSLVYWNATLTGIQQVIQFTQCVFDTFTTNISTAARGGVIGNGSSVSQPSQTSITINFDRCLLNNIKRTGDSAPYSAFVNILSSKFTIRFRETTFYNSSAGNALDKIVASDTSGLTVPYFRNCIFNSEEATPPTFSEVFGGASDVSTFEYGDYYGMDTTGAVITNSINADPQFVDKAAKDFRLKATSPCIDTGVLV